ncbi:MAG: hypothetical protein QM704_14795 [Anaeromyxobacteraceae bacterium]
MHELKFDRWTLHVDPVATALAYESISPGPEDCGCDECRNFAAQRERIYPREFLELCARLGIPPGKEGEVYGCGGGQDGRHFYGGWFHFVGSVENRAELDFGRSRGNGSRHVLAMGPARLPRPAPEAEGDDGGAATQHRRGVGRACDGRVLGVRLVCSPLDREAA